ncbi:unnamed protein product [Pylaiella littoralis]
MASTRSFSLLCLFMMTARILGFVLHSSRLASRAASKFHLQRCTRARTWPRYVATRSATRLRMMSDDFSGDSFGAKAMKERTDAELQEMVSSHNILAFIKGNRLMPQCGYSGTVVNILQSLSVPFETVDVMADDRIRQGIKDFSDWPTIPQLYLGGEFIGGADIVIELFQSGELQEMIEVAAAS